MYVCHLSCGLWVTSADLAAAPEAEDVHAQMHVAAIVVVRKGAAKEPRSLGRPRLCLIRIRCIRCQIATKVSTTERAIAEMKEVHGLESVADPVKIPEDLLLSVLVLAAST
jgi:hypothetical protein